MIAGSNGVYICDDCIELCAEILEEELGDADNRGGLDFSGINLLKPKEIKEFLDEYVVGQEEAKRCSLWPCITTIRESLPRAPRMWTFRRAIS